MNEQCTWNGVTYPSVKAAAVTLGITPGAMRYRISRGYKCDSDLHQSYICNHRKPCVWNGVKYESIAAAAKANFISNNGMSYRLGQGYTSDSDLWNGS